MSRGTHHYRTEHFLLRILSFGILLWKIPSTQVNHWKYRKNFIFSSFLKLLSFFNHLSIHSLHIFLSPFLLSHLHFLLFFHYLLFLWMFNHIDCLTTLLGKNFLFWDLLKILWFCLNSPKILNKSRLIELFELILSFKNNQVIQVLGFVETLYWWCLWGVNYVWIFAVRHWGNKVWIVVIIDERQIA